MFFFSFFTRWLYLFIRFCIRYSPLPCCVRLFSSTCPFQLPVFRLFFVCLFSVKTKTTQRKKMVIYQSLSFQHQQETPFFRLLLVHLCHFLLTTAFFFFFEGLYLVVVGELLLLCALKVLFFFFCASRMESLQIGVVL